jgi:tetratricopeptide (TPR) repeat protein
MIFGGSERLMKKLITFLSILTTVAILALPVAARNAVARPDNSLQDQCSQEAKDALYQSFLKNRQADQAKAFEDAKKYLACPAGQVTEAQQKIIDYLKKWSTTYEKEVRKVQLPILLYNDQKYPEAYALGKQILADEPDNLYVLVHLGASGYLVAPLKNAGLTGEAVGYARKALQLLEAGQNLEKWEPLQNRDVALAYLNYTIGSLTLEQDPAAALKNLIKAAQYETPLKKSPYTHAYIAGAYETGAYAKQSEEYKRMYSGKDETPESKLALANINQIVDRMIDAYARAVAVAGTDPKHAQAKASWQESLTTWYKYRNSDKTDGMNELVAGILTKPLPPEPTPLTVLPASTPAATPATNNATGTNGTATAPAGTTTTTKPASTTTPATGTKPAPAKPDKPRNRR